MKKLIPYLAIALFIPAIVYAAFSVPQGGTGTGSITGIIQGNGTSAFTPVTIGAGLSYSGGTLSSTGGATQTLQTVTDNGSLTTNAMTVKKDADNFAFHVQNLAGNDVLNFGNGAAGAGFIQTMKPDGSVGTNIEGDIVTAGKMVFGATSAFITADASNNLSFGNGAGTGNTGSNNFNLGLNAGAGNNSLSTVSVGSYAGQGATNASGSFFLGDFAGNNAPNAANSIFIGRESGKDDSVDNTASGYGSILIGNYTRTNGHYNSIVLGNGPGGFTVSNTADNQFLLTPTISNFSFRGNNYVLPAASANGVLTNAGGTLSWTAASSGTVTSITAGTGLSGGTITSTGTISLANTAVSAGSYTSANITVDAQGRITSASNGTSGTVSGSGTQYQVATWSGTSSLTGSSGFTYDANSLLNVAGASLSGSSATGIMSLTQTWNTSGNPTAFKLNVTNTASGASSLLADFQVGGTSQFTIDKGGNIKGSANGLTISGGTSHSINMQSTVFMVFDTNVGVSRDDGFVVANGRGYAFTPSGTTNTADMALYRYDGNSLVITNRLGAAARDLRLRSMTMGAAAVSAAAWGTSGISLNSLANTYTDTSTSASTTVASIVASSFGIPTFAASNAGVTYTNASTLYIAGAPAAGTNVTITNPYSLYVAAGNVIAAGGNVYSGTSGYSYLGSKFLSLDQFASISNGGIGFSSNSLIGYYQNGFGASGGNGGYITNSGFLAVAASQIGGGFTLGSFGIKTVSRTELTVGANKRTFFGTVSTLTNFTSSTGVLVAPNGNFVPSDVGATLIVDSGSGQQPFSLGTITAYNSATSVTLSNPYGTGNFYGSTSQQFAVQYSPLTASGQFLGTGTRTPSALFHMGAGGSLSYAAWGTSGIALRQDANTYTDTSTSASGTVASNMVNALAVPTLSSTNVSVTYTNAANLYIAGSPSAGTNVTITNPYSLYVASGKSYFGGAMVVNGTISSGGLDTSTGGLVSGNGMFRVTTARNATTSAGGLVWSTGADSNTGPFDLGILRGAANTLYVSDGTAANANGNIYARNIVSMGTVRLNVYTVATLPAGTQGDTAAVSDAILPSFLGTLTGGGSVYTPVTYNGTAWVPY